MPLTGTLRSWNEDRGFGFIAPRDGGRELFVHISAFPRDGSRPSVGESLTYEVGPGKDDKPQAVRVFRQALGKPAEYPRARQFQSSRRKSPFTALIGILLAVGVGVYAYSAYQRSHRGSSASVAGPQAVVRSKAPESVSPTFRCDGRTYCSQMTSCTEAKFFLKNCPGTEMDGNNDGVPCEKQWCTSLFAK